jgi:DNA-binding CsgD family transcriptional regulator
MNDSASRHTHRVHGPTVVIVVDDPTQLPADLAPLVGHLQRLTWPNGPPSIQIVTARTRPGSEAPFVERRRRTTDRRQSTCVLLSPSKVASRADSNSPPQTLSCSPPFDAQQPCTDREREIVELLRRGMTNKEIGQQLGIMEETVKKHLQHIYDKFGVRRRALVMLGQVASRSYSDRNPAFP